MIKKKPFKLIFFFVTLCLALFLWSKDFFRISTKATGQPGYYQGGIWADLNNDGLIDVFLLAKRAKTSTQETVTVVTENNQLFLQQPDGSFRKVHDDPLVNTKGDFMATTIGDYNNDGTLDIFIANGDAGTQANNLDHKNLLFANNGNGSFTRILDQELVEENLNSVACSWGDYDDDGFLDLYVCNRGAKNSLFHNQGDGTFLKVSNIPPAEDSNGYGCSWADPNNDGLVDLFVAHAGDQPCALYQNEGEGVFVDVTPSKLTNDVLTNTRQIILSLWIDYDNDLALLPGGEETPRLYKNRGDGGFSKVFIGPFQADLLPGHAAAFGDYDNDGDLDVFVAGKDQGGLNLFYANNGDGTFSQLFDGMIVSDSTESTVACKWWDINLDGFLDMYMIRRIDENKLYQNRLQENNWLTIWCEGGQSNRSAVGTMVQVTARVGGQLLKQIRLITGQPEGDQYLHFGLGDSEMVEEVSIKWPSGHWQILGNITPNQRLTIYEEFAAIVLPPNQFKVNRVENSLLFFKEYINRLEWQPNPDNINAISYYRLYRKSKGSSDSEYEYLSRVDGQVFYFEDKMLAPSQLFTYKITAVSQEGRRSDPVFASN